MEVEYYLPQKKKEIQVKWIVYNDSVEKNMYFSIGGHPGFVYQVEDKKANYVCLEPWYGICDEYGYTNCVV